MNPLGIAFIGFVVALVNGVIATSDFKKRTKIVTGILGFIGVIVMAVGGILWILE